MEFVLEALDPYLQPTGDGPITSVASLTVSESLDEVATLSANVSAKDTRAHRLLTNGRRFRARFANGMTSHGVVREDSLTASSAQRTISGFDLLDELVRFTCGYWANYQMADIHDNVLPDLLAGTGWSWAVLDGNLGQYSGNLDNLTRLEGIQRMRDLTGRHFRRGLGLRTLEFGTFGASQPDVRLTNVDHFLRDQDDSNIAIVSELVRTRSSSSKVNLVVPLGRGEDNGDTNRAKVNLYQISQADTTRLARIKVRPGLNGAATKTISGSDFQTLKVESTAGFREQGTPTMQLFVGNASDLTAGYQFNWAVGEIGDANTMFVVNSGDPEREFDPPGAGVDVIGDPQYYLVDAASYAADPSERVMIFPEIDALGRPEPPEEQWREASRLLFDRALYWLRWNSVEQIAYQVNVLRLPFSVRVGDRIPMVYTGYVVDRSGVTVDWINVNDLFYVLSIDRTFNADGTLSASLTLSNLDRQLLADRYLISQLAGNLEQVNVTN
ncbi:MAG TPA: hypothetical protein VJG32_18030 [Anaerolineae bacterium]|nr:hypothetical protein [Anaerolineae bacterium]